MDYTLINENTLAWHWGLRWTNLCVVAGRMRQVLHRVLAWAKSLPWTCKPDLSDLLPFVVAMLVAWSVLLWEDRAVCGVATFLGWARLRCHPVGSKLPSPGLSVTSVTLALHISRCKHQSVMWGKGTYPQPQLFGCEQCHIKFASLWHSVSFSLDCSCLHYRLACKLICHYKLQSCCRNIVGAVTLVVNQLIRLSNGQTYLTDQQANC